MLVRTVCVQMDWHTPGGSPRLGFGLRVLRELQRRGIVQLPPKRGPGRGPQKPLQFDDRTAPRPLLREPLAQLAPVRLETATEPEQAALWKGFRAFAVDGSKLNLPRELVQEGYTPPSPQAHYPQGLLSCLYQIGRRLPCDFALHPHRDERRAALQHLAALGPGDLVVYDRGYYSFALLQAHTDRQVAAVFRLKRNASGRVRDFVAGSSCDEVVSVEPTETAHCRLPAADLTPCRLRLVKYAINNTVYALGTTLLDAKRYPAAELADLYHGRWSVEELYKISKELLEIESFHSRSERTVKQELYAHFTLIAMARLFASRCERQFESRVGEAGRPPLRANFNHSLGAVERELEGLLLHQAPQLRDTLNRVLEHAARSPQRERPGRSYPRRSRRPSKKWRNRKPADPQTAD